MDVHRSRFVPFPTSAITALAFSRSSDSGYESTPPALRLALGRANGAIEIWNPFDSTWVQEAIFVGDQNSIDGLVWTQDPDERDADGGLVIGQQRLFSIASSPSVTEWDLATGLPKRTSTGNFSEVWCFAAQPRWRPQKNPSDTAQHSDILVGCGDGTMALLSTADDDLTFKRFLARVSGKKARCMCVTYQNRDVAVAGFADSIIRVYDTKSGASLRSLSLGVGIPGAPKDALVWQVKCLPNGDIVSADSNGEVRFWDGRTYSLSQRVTGHDADCLDLAVSHDGKTVFSGSIDGKMAVYRLSANPGGRRTWSKASHRRVHQGEVKSLAAFDSKGMSVIVSGGSDVAPVVTPLRDFGREMLRTLPALPQASPVTSAPRVRLLVSWHERDILVWRIAKQGEADSAAAASPRKLVARIMLDTKCPIRDVAITDDGRLLAAVTVSESRVFQLRKRPDHEGLAIRKVELPKSLSTIGARLVRISPDGKWLAFVALDDEVHVARVLPEHDRPKLLRVLSKTVELERTGRKAPNQTGLRGYETVVTHAAFSSDSSMLATCDRAGFVDTWVLEGHEDTTSAECESAARDSAKGSSIAGSDSSDSDSSDDDDIDIVLFHGQHWADNPAGNLPRIDSSPLVLTFRPTPDHQARGLVNGNPGVHATRHNPHAHSHSLPPGPHLLVAVTAKHSVYEFDADAGRLSSWSRRNPSSVLPRDFHRLRDRAMGAVWDMNGSQERLWLYGYTWVFMLDLKQEFGDGQETDTKKKRRRKSNTNDADVNGSPQKRLKINGERSDQTKADEERDGEAVDDAAEDDRRLVTSNRDALAAAKSTANGSKHWHTFKYKPILGMASLADSSALVENAPLEVVLVECPFDERSR
ncbi:small nucleolar ribonucleoprotein-like protein complex subunit [Polychaeton citri CBS 116435]|uniref:Small nucleolar ribonucleoprotein-like protein complex subunit n=1 Tax=Polychaeton citri CBS 116435 TaxID=1314669 RepID=A0A9P4UKT6_9PEZI|nr:small nucleolar ribonucleoprotein-like protein complex subunit [Polychaeton citri CBS 116435]